MGAGKLFCELDAADDSMTISVEARGAFVALLAGDAVVRLDPNAAQQLATSIAAATWHVQFGGD